MSSVLISDSIAERAALQRFLPGEKLGDVTSITPIRLGLSGATQIKRSDFGISNFVLNQFTGDEVDVAFEVEFEKK